MDSEPNPNSNPTNNDINDDDNESDMSYDDNNDDDDSDDGSSTNDDDKNDNNSPIPVFLCPRCSGLFFSQHRRNVHFINEMLTMCSQEVVNILKARGVFMTKPRVSHHRYASCSIEHLRLRRRSRYPRPHVGRIFRRLDSDSLFKVLAHAHPSPFPTQVPGFFPKDFDPLPVVLNGHDVTLPSQPLPPSTLTPSPNPNRVNQGQSVAPMSDRNVVIMSRSNMMSVHRLATRQEGEAPPPRQQSRLGCNNGSDNDIKEEEEPKPEV